MKNWCIGWQRADHDRMNVTEHLNCPDWVTDAQTISHDKSALLSEVLN